MLEKCQPYKQLIARIVLPYTLESVCFQLTEVMKFAESKSALFMAKDTPVLSFFFRVP